MATSKVLNSPGMSFDEAKKGPSTTVSGSVSNNNNNNNVKNKVKTICEFSGTVIHGVDIKGHKPLWFIPSERDDSRRK